ncbi:hypothetical protein Pan216_08770 [Planctomycetes bacterium Pan216]|uniref:Uncharacterized protein n=1 Tax=Kolteria novifilia TaxID=2527975 RepID=A0A518AZA4_9BACT|nr:hypothetical protein Pan216_08770 [Planctomycetes bacterium Pan216]
MVRVYVPLLLTLMLLSTSLLGDEPRRPRVRVQASVIPRSALPGGEVFLSLEIRIPSGYVAYDTEQVAGSVMPTRIRFNPSRYYVPLEAFESPEALEKREPRFHLRVVRYYRESPVFRRRLLIRKVVNVNAIPIEGTVDCLITHEESGRSYLMSGLPFSTSLGVLAESRTLKVGERPTLRAVLRRESEADSVALHLDVSVFDGMRLVPIGRSKGAAYAPSRLFIDEMTGVEPKGPLELPHDTGDTGDGLIQGPTKRRWTQPLRLLDESPLVGVKGRIVFSLVEGDRRTSIEQPFEARLEDESPPATQAVSAVAVLGGVLKVQTPREKAVVASPMVTETATLAPPSDARSTVSQPAIAEPVVLEPIVSGSDDLAHPVAEADLSEPVGTIEISTVDFGPSFRAETKRSDAMLDLKNPWVWVGGALVVVVLILLLSSDVAQRFLDRVVS